LDSQHCIKRVQKKQLYHAQTSALTEVVMNLKELTLHKVLGEEEVQVQDVQEVVEVQQEVM